jgi:hypothetical protein
LLATSATSFDLVRAVRVNGKPRHEFLLGLGSQKDYEDDAKVVPFWATAISQMAWHKIADHQRSRLIADMVRKGARLPTPEQCTRHLECEPEDQPWVEELTRWLSTPIAQPCTADTGVRS